ncbi:conjugal transfer protein TraD [Burkholderia ubonensis]|uniref:conjugal transfer protein TraD n=1 Tax=Burkholderia ubonensis TaxID=101571 RepID=UPI000BA54B66|nr:conjugal transfer protein TraD [Burkholderia ubonensis]PAJ87802.1 conjugal transfer protein TraD [Burkholderia ubonensis]PAK08346.1 conjugal transfer protein TraD [Burkholderia ubonensis]RQP83588.1 conjugal transfer protein TraD [Burkholderia ubonensis]RQQ12006.1 conjugal transfer protein TraD [Burkholderia ubonensis]
MPKADLTQALTAIEPKTKAAKVREVMPVIEQRIAAGVRIADILKTLRDGGIELTAATLKSYLYRYRKKGRTVGRPAESVGQRSAGTLASVQPGDSVSYETEPETRAPREPISMQELDRVMKPDPAKQAEDLARYERIARQQWKGRKQ